VALLRIIALVNIDCGVYHCATLLMMRFIPVLMITSLLEAQQYSVVDIERVRAAGNSATAIRIFAVPPQPREIACDILVAGAGMGGAAAAMRAAARGHTVCLTEETDWVGGQLTAGGVSALDENRFIEISGGTRTYYELRRRIRDYYRSRYRLTPDAIENLNPGSCYVSPLCFEPKAGVAALEEMMKPFPIQTFLRTRIVDAKVVQSKIQTVLAYQFDRNEVIRFRPKFVLDATELGDLLPLAHVPYVVGSEPKSETNEPHASASANNACVQSFTYPFAVEHRPGEQHRVARPDEYERFRDSQPFSLKVNYPKEYGWKGDVQYTMFGEDPPIPNNMSPRPFFTWRRLLAAKNFDGPNAPRDLALVNWPKQDYHSESLLDRTPQDTARILQQAKRVSLAFLYWLQNDLPRDDGKGSGYPELMLRKDVMDTEDGLSKVPYIRESRRIRAQARVTEQDIVIENDQPRARWFPDSIGTGFYMVDIHPCGANERGRMMMPKPFQVPMGALVPQAVTNLLAAGKNIGVTHLTNGAFRLHPIEWNVGEAAAVIASLTLEHGAAPSPAATQLELATAGVPLVWFDDLSVDHPAFAAIQLAAIGGKYPLGASDLHASPEAPVTRGEAATALAAQFGHKLSSQDAIALAIKEGWMAVDHRNWFHADLPFYWTDWREDRFPVKLSSFRMTRTGPVRRSELAQRLQ
jgi:hypothetical protein